VCSASLKAGTRVSIFNGHIFCGVKRYNPRGCMPDKASNRTAIKQFNYDTTCFICGALIVANTNVSIFNSYIFCGVKRYNPDGCMPGSKESICTLLSHIIKKGNLE